MSEERKRQILPTCAVPSFYDLTLTPDLKNFVFNGEVLVQLEIKEETSAIVFNTREVDISYAAFNNSVSVMIYFEINIIIYIIKKQGNQELTKDQISQDVSQQQTTLTFSTPLKTGSVSSIHVKKFRK